MNFVATPTLTTTRVYDAKIVGICSSCDIFLSFYFFADKSIMTSMVQESPVSSLAFPVLIRYLCLKDKDSTEFKQGI